LGNLDKALAEQHENLGMQAIEHQPPGLNIGVQMTEIANIQQELVQKQATLESLQQTKGSASVAKDLKKEVSALRLRQREQMIAIGQQTEAAKPGLAGVEGHYSAIQQLRASIETKQAELSSLEVELGPVFDLDVKNMSLEQMRPWLLPAGGVLLALLLLFFVVPAIAGALFANSLPGWTDDYLDENVVGVGYAEVSSIITNPFVEDLMDSVPGGADLPGGLAPEDFNDVLMIVLSDGESVGVFRLHEDMELDDLLPSDNTGDESVLERQDYRGTEYVSIGLGNFSYGRTYVSKPDNRTYCVSDNEDALKKVLARFDKRDEGVELDEDMLAMVSRVGGEDAYFVARVTGPLAMAAAMTGEVEGVPEFDRIDAFGVGLSMSSSSVSVTGAAQFDRDRDARRWKEDVDTCFDDFEQFLKYAPPEHRETAEDAADLIKRLKVKQSGKAAYVSGKWSVNEIEGIIDAMP